MPNIIGRYPFFAFLSISFLIFCISTATFISPAFAGCTATNLTVANCDSTQIVLAPNPGTSSAVVDNVSSVGIFADAGRPNATGTYTESLILSGTTVLDNSVGHFNVNGGAGISMGWIDNPNNGSNVTSNANLTISSGVTINSHAQYGGAVFLRTEYAGNLSVNNAGTVISLGVDNTNTAFSNAAVNSGASFVDGLTATTALGAVSVVNSGSVTAYSGRGLYADGNSSADTRSDCCTVTGFTGAPEETVSLVNTATGVVNAYLAGMRAVDYYGLATITNAGTVHSTARQALVAWSAWGDSNVSNSGTATADDRNAIVAATETGNATILNSGTVVASMASTGTQSAGIGYSGLRAYADTTGNVSITNTGDVTANYDAAVVAHTPSGNAIVTNAGTLKGLNGVFIDSGAGIGSVDTVNDTNATATNTIAGTATFVNTGTVTAVNYGAYLDGTSNSLTNTGKITASSGTGVVTGSGGRATITNSGAISGTAYGLDLGAATTVNNSGTISGGAAAIRFDVGGNTLNVVNSSIFTGGVAFQSTASNTINFYTGSYTLPVKDYLLASNSIYLLGTAKTLVTSGLDGSGTGNIQVVDTSVVGALDRATVDVLGQVSGVIGDILDLDIERPDATLAPRVHGGALAYAEDEPAAKTPIAIVLNERADQALAIDDARNLYWMRGFYGTRHQDGDATLAGSLAHQYGTVAGVDHLYDDWRIGAYGGAGRAATTLSGDAGSLDANMALAGVYARRSFGQLSFDTALTGGWIWATTDRGINLGSSDAHGSFGGRFVSPEAALSVKYALDRNWSLTPILKARYIATFFDAYTETGSSQNVSYDSQATQNLEERLDLRLSSRLTKPNELPSTFWVQGGVLSTQRLAGAAYGASVSGAEFTVQPVSDAVVYGGTLSVGVDIAMTQQTSVFGNLEGALLSDGSQSFRARGGLKIGF